MGKVEYNVYEILSSSTYLPLLLPCQITITLSPSSIPQARACLCTTVIITKPSRWLSSLPSRHHHEPKALACTDQLNQALPVVNSASHHELPVMPKSLAAVAATTSRLQALLSALQEKKTESRTGRKDVAIITTPSCTNRASKPAGNPGCFTSAASIKLSQWGGGFLSLTKLCADG
ncbi:hypothetical protein M0R45_018274 [Rubus argutus]|uniref:Uncharacterized protein n=1 Tax=Rubus argutus TaxID=59490 RepID=A0AAW1X4N8_RUBAR